MNEHENNAAVAEALAPDEEAHERGWLDTEWVECFLTRDRSLLHRLIYAEFGLWIPRVAVCHDHSAPFDFVADMLFGEVRKAIVLANRSGGKTLNLALIHVIRSTVNSLLAGVGLSTVHVAAVNIQATRCYDYVKKLNKTPFIERYIRKGKELISHTEYTTDAKMEIVPGTMNSVNGPHPPFATFDEVELAPWDVIQEFMSMSQSVGDVANQDIFTSTRKRVAGSMQRLLDEAPQRGIRTYAWCIFEVLQRNEVCSLETCGIVGCAGRCTRADGYYPVKDAAEKQQTLDKKTWDEQWECKRPGRSGLVYEEFENEPGVLHVQEFDPRTDAAQELFVGEDFGFTNMNVALLAYWHVLPSGQRQLRIFDEVTSTKLKDSLVLDAELARLEAWGFEVGQVSAWWADPSGAGEIQERRDKGLPVRTITKQELKVIEEGVRIVRKAFSMNPYDGSVGVLVHPRCVELRRQLGLYAYPDPTKVTGPSAEKPIKRDDHAPDALRMLVVGEYSLLPSEGDNAGGEVVSDAAWEDPYAERDETASDDPF